MTLEEIKAIAETWFEWPEEKREQVTYTSAMLFARDMYERGQQAEREKYQELIAAAKESYPTVEAMLRLWMVLEKLKEKMNG